MSGGDEQLIRDALEGRQDAFTALVERYQRPVFNLIARLVGDHAVAEELAQETFLKAFRRLETYDVGRGLAPWLLRIAHNTAVDALRRKRPGTATLDPDRAPASSAPGPDRETEHRLLARELTTAIDGLRPEHRAALVLRFQEGQSYQEIAHVLGVAEGTARSHVHRARRQLADAMHRAGWGRAPRPRATNGPSARSTE